jgi:hypothetical protein
MSVKKILFILLFASAFVTSGCKGVGGLKLIDRVSFRPSPNLESVRVSLVFADTIKTNLTGGYPIKDYGSFFINPWTASEPFEVGFELNTNIVNDQDYIKLTPTEVLPNGVPIGLSYALVQVQAPHPISPMVDIYGYVDVLRQAWLGVAGIFGFINNTYVPEGLSVTQVFLRDANNKPGVIASVFGPSTGIDGTVRPGGIALFANVKQLLSNHVMGEGAPAETTLYPETYPLVAGPKADEYRGQYRKLQNLESGLANGFNQARQ